MMSYGLLALVAAGLSIMVTPWVRGVAAQFGVIDVPGGHRMHLESIPSLGGLAVLVAWFVALSAGLLVENCLFSRVVFRSVGQWPWLGTGALIIVATGVADDIWDLPSGLKLGLETAAGVLVLVGGFRISVITLPLARGSIALGWLAFPLTLVWIVGITNSFNLLDGLDGLTAGVAVVVSVTMWAVSVTTGRLDVAFVLTPFIGALIGFLCYNFPPASIFLGDSGSLLVGYVLAVLPIRASHYEGIGVMVMIPLLTLGVPILDTLLAVIRRLWRTVRAMRNDPEYRAYHLLVVAPLAVLRPDQEHIHHYLLSLGLVPRHAVLVLYGVSAGLGLLALLVLSDS